MSCYRSVLKYTTVLALAGVIFLPSMAFAACMQQNAVYKDRDGHYTLSFKPVTKGGVELSVPTTNEFTITSDEKPDFSLDGMVIWPEDSAPRPLALVTYRCSENGENQDAFDDCSVWQNVVYALKDQADAGLLPKAEEPAAHAILFPDFIGALNSYDFGDAGPSAKLEWEVFRFKQCAVEE